MTAITKHLGGNMIPITLLVQDLGTVLDHSSVTVGTHKDPEPDASTKKSCGGDAVANSDEFGLDNKVMQAMFHFSFGQTVQAFLSGKDLTGLEILNAASSFPKGNSLLCGYLYFEGNKVNSNSFDEFTSTHPFFI